MGDRKENIFVVIFTPLLPSRHPAGLLSALARGHRLAAGLGIPWSVDGSAALPLLMTDPSNGEKRKLMIIINWVQIALFIDSSTLHCTLNVFTQQSLL